MKSLIQKIVSTPGPSGYEKQIRDVIQEEIGAFSDEIRVDALGNLIARKGSGGKRFMIAAHMDEIGIIVTHVDKNGFIRFTNIGGVFPRYCPSGRVRFLDGTELFEVDVVTENTCGKLILEIGFQFFRGGRCTVHGRQGIPHLRPATTAQEE